MILGNWTGSILSSTILVCTPLLTTYVNVVTV